MNDPAKNSDNASENQKPDDAAASNANAPDGSGNSDGAAGADGEPSAQAGAEAGKDTPDVSGITDVATLTQALTERGFTVEQDPDDKLDGALNFKALLEVEGETKQKTAVFTEDHDPDDYRSFFLDALAEMLG